MESKLLTEFLYERQVVRMTLNAPKGNVLDMAMMGEIHTGLNALKNEPQVKLIQFTGAGPHFSFGAAVGEHSREKAPAMLEQFHGLFYALMDLAIPTAALVSGQCLGGGLEFALMCNFLFADDTARLGQPEITLAVFAPPASLILPLKAGQARADDLLLTGRSITATEAKGMGLAAEAYESREAMMAGVDRWVTTHILPKSASSFRIAVRAARLAFNEAVRDGLRKLEKMYVSELMATHDANEGIAAFLDRRTATWENR
jgi:cyclohexa-1,5-dienecarbonyl-CoA hydratase